MSWLFSQALVEEYSVDTSLDGEQSAPLNGNPTQQAYCAPDKMTAFSRLSRFGMTYKPLTESRGEDLLTLYRAGFHAKTLAQLEKGQELTESAAGCGEKWRASFTKYSPNSRSWKTHQCSLFGDLEPFLETWPQWGLMRDGECWEQTPLGLVTIEKEFGYWPTPTASDWKAAGKLEMLKRQGDKYGAGHQNRPQYHYARKYNMKMPLAAQEILMKWPLGWTDLKPLATDKCHSVLQQPGSFSVNSGEICL
jgi:hypothetical protein